MNKDELMLRAVALAERNAASVTGGPFGAVIVKDGKVVAEASNTVTVDNPMCLAACYWAHIDRVYYAADREDAAAAGFDDSDIYREVALPVDGRKIPFVHIMEKEGLRPFMLWASNDRKVEY